MNRLFLCTLLAILLSTNLRYSGSSTLSGVPGGSRESAGSSLDSQTARLATANPVAQSAVQPARELIERWCAAYRALNAGELVALQSPDIAIVDRFGILHAAKQPHEQERFWADGFQMIRREGFHPLCHIAEIRATHPDVVIVHAAIAYPGGIPLQDGDYIPAFSEIHTFIVSRRDLVWRIAELDSTQRVLQ
jgi:ketosteroid isomerase-like protein